MTFGRYFKFCFKQMVRSRHDLLLPVYLFLFVSVMFPLAFPSGERAMIGSGAVWITALVTMVLSLDKMFREDVEDGFMVQLVVLDTALPMVAFVKILTHSIGFGGPLLMALPLLALWHGLSAATLQALFLGLLLGLPTLIALGSVVAALGATLKNSGVLLMVIVLPLTIPVFLLGLGAADLASHGMPSGSAFNILIAMSVGSVTVCPFATGFVLRYFTE